MTVDHDTRAWDAAAACADTVTADLSVRTAARQAVMDLPRTTRDVLAAERFADLVAHILRSRTRDEERSAARPAERPESLPEYGPPDPWAGMKHGNKRGASERGCPCEHCEWSRQLERDSAAKLNASLNNLLADYRKDLRMEWTEELLESTFALGDGTRVSWGEATIDQHQERVAMFMGNVAANIEGAARHEQAIVDIKTAEVSCLSDVVPAQSVAA